MIRNGLCGRNFKGLIYSCFWDTQSSSVYTSEGGVGKTTVEMMDINTYAGWGDDIWTIDNGNDYPHLAWENRPGIPIIDAPRTYSGGAGTIDAPYLIAQFDDLFELGIYSADWNKHYKLTNDIDLSAFVFNICIVPMFTGVFDGNGYRINNLTIDTLGLGSSYLGLFGKIYGGQTEVKNLGLGNINIKGGDASCYVGSLCGYNENGIIRKCYIDFDIKVGNEGEYFGGLGDPVLTLHLGHFSCIV